MTDFPSGIVRPLGFANKADAGELQLLGWTAFVVLLWHHLRQLLWRGVYALLGFIALNALFMVVTWSDMPCAIPHVSRTSIWKRWNAVRKELKNSSIRDVVDLLQISLDKQDICTDGRCSDRFIA